MKRTFWFAFLLLMLSIPGNSQENKNSTDPLLVTSSKFKLLATNVSYRGEECEPSAKTDEVYSASSAAIRVGGDIYYESYRFSSHRGDGLVAEYSAKTCRIYRMFGLAKAVGWYKPKEDEGSPDATRGVFRVKNSIWMGSNGIGIVVFDLKRKTWSRFDLKSSAIPGDHAGVDYADDNYAFVTRGEFPGAALHIYSVKQDRWLGLKAVSTELVCEFGYTTGMVQIGIDHRPFAKQKYLPLDWTFMYPEVTKIKNGQSYLFEKKFEKSKTVIEITRLQLEQVFKNAARSRKSH